MSEKKFRQLPVIDFKYNGVEEPLSYIRTGYFHPKVGRLTVSNSKRLPTPNGVTESQKFIKIKSKVLRSKSKQKELHKFESEKPVIFQSIKNYLMHNKGHSPLSPKLGATSEIPDNSAISERPRSSFAVLKRLRYDMSKKLVMNLSKGEKSKLKKFEKIHIILKSPEIEL